MKNCTSLKFTPVVLLVILITGLPYNIKSQNNDLRYSKVEHDVDIKNRETPQQRGIVSGLKKKINSKLNDNNGVKKESEIPTHNLERLNTLYKSREKYPTTIIDGWHNVAMTDNVSSYRDAKALIEGNVIKRLVIENYLPITFMPLEELRNGKMSLTVVDPNTDKHEIMDLYFLYDLDKPATTTEPDSPGYICFWSDWLKFESIRISLEDNELSKLSNQFTMQPECFQEGMVCLKKKPGIYSFKAGGQGTIKWSGEIEVKSGMCASYRLGKKN